MQIEYLVIFLARLSAIMHSFARNHLYQAFSDEDCSLDMLQKLLRALNREVSSFTGSGKAPMEYSLEKVISHICSDVHADQPLQVFCRSLLKNMKSHLNDKYVAYRKVYGLTIWPHAATILLLCTHGYAFYIH